MSISETGAFGLHIRDLRHGWQAASELSKAQLRRRDVKIAKLWLEGVTEEVLAVRFGLTEAEVRKVAMRRVAANPVG